MLYDYAVKGMGACVLEHRLKLRTSTLLFFWNAATSCPRPCYSEKRQQGLKSAEEEVVTSTV